ncbi:RNA polymerase sigma factor [Polymorphospora rubra]|uniref:RNA polymerase sigma factor n=1 Tax=Polymorphospora rubra TaxID=338584 RepID=UPI0033D951C7
MPDDRPTAADRQRLTDLFRRHGDAIHAYVLHRLGGEDAEDLVAEVFAVAWRRLAEIKVGEERPWLFGVARRLVMQHRRHRADRAALQVRLLSETGSDDGPGSDPATTERAEVVAALAKLPEADREVLLLRYWYDLSGRESAKVLGCTTATFAVRLHRARRRFRRTYEDGSTASKALPASSLTASTRELP